jgi:hypothetical protein
MAAPSAQNIKRVPGTLVENPTNLAIAPPHGGTILGLTRSMIFKPGIRSTQVTAEELGGTAVEAYYTGENVVFTAILREFDPDAITAIFPRATVGASGDPMIEYQPDGSHQARPGMRLSTKAIKLLFVPKATDSHPYIIVYKALPAVEETLELMLAFNHELGVPVMFYGIPDDASSRKVYQIGRKEDISLT